MANNSKTALVLILGGIVCILASIGAITFLYHEHAVLLNTPHEAGEPGNFEMFLISVGLPSLAGLIIGIGLVALGITKDKAS